VKRLRQEGVMEKEEEIRRRRAEENRRLEGYRCLTSDDREPKSTGVLLSDEIKHYVDLCKMIDPFLEKNLKAAGYELTVGDECSVGGKLRKLTEGEEIRIEAFQVAVIKTRETLNLPRFIIARWNIRVRWAYEGLLWVGGPQVDPGWVGTLCCPIYNLSDKPVTLRCGDPIALMDFVTTTPFNQASAKHQYNRPPKRVLFQDYSPDTLKSALYTEARERINQVEERTERRIGTVEALVTNFVAVSVTVVGIFVAVLAFFISPERKTVPLWVSVSLLLSGLSLVLLVLIYVAVKSQTKR
jgi:deoxycytidine triphosphate deaminase